MRLRQFLFLLLLSIQGFSQPGLPPVGQWRELLPWTQVRKLVQDGETLWGATPYSLFSLDLRENSIQRFSKVNGLSGTGISDIAADPASGKIIVAYSNSNVDLLDGDQVYTIRSIANSSIAGDKTLRSVFIKEGLAYIGSGIGIIVADINRKEVKATYIIGASGNATAVTAVTADAQYLYAETSEGLKRCALAGTNPADYRNWTLLSGTNGLPAGNGTALTLLNQQPVFAVNDTVYRLNGNWSAFFSNGETISSLSITGSGLIVCTTTPNSGAVTVLSGSGATQSIIRNGQYFRQPAFALQIQQSLWIADNRKGLLQYDGNLFSSYQPNSPDTVLLGKPFAAPGILYIPPYSLQPGWNSNAEKAGIGLFSGNNWQLISAATIPAFDSLPGINSLLVEGPEVRIWGSSWGGGLFSLTAGQLTVYKQNSPLRSPAFAPGEYRVGGLALDAEQQLWVTNYGATNNLHVRKADGSWRSFSIPLPLNENAAGAVLVDDLNQKWIQLPKAQGLVCFNHGNNIDNPGDDRWKWYRAGAGNGNLPDNEVLSLARDRNGFIWVGTRNGIGVIQCIQDIFSSPGCEALLPVVQQDNFAGYLFKGEEVQAIAVDGADRKWIGTKNGVWLISADAEKTIYRFTVSNSPLPDNDIRQIAIDPQSGEVYFSTPKGMVAYRSTATAGGSSNTDVLVFPNPVPPGYTGSIAIRGLVDNAIVKITEPDGRLVAELRALGGQAIWNGKNTRGQTVSSGVYLVLIRDENQQEKAVTKIVFIGR